MQKQIGFTLVEILVVLAVVVLLSIITFQSFTSLNSVEALNKEALQVASIIHQAQSQTLASRNADQYGVHFEATQVTFFEGSSFVAGSGTNVVTPLNPAVTISGINLTGGGSDIIFDRLTGTTADYGTTTLSLIASSTQTKKIVVYPSGTVDIN